MSSRDSPENSGMFLMISDKLATRSHTYLELRRVSCELSNNLIRSTQHFRRNSNPDDTGRSQVDKQIKFFRALYR